MWRDLCVAGAALAALSGCAGEGGGPAGSAAGAPPGFACPPPGTTIAISDGRRLTYGQASASDPFVCEAQKQDGSTVRLLANHYELPIPDEANVRRGMAALWPLEPGKTTSFVRDQRTVNGALVRFETNWRVIGERSMDIGGSPRRVMVLEMREEVPTMSGYAGTWTYFYDTTARAIVGGDINMLRGVNRAQNWRATSITVPG